MAMVYKAGLEQVQRNKKIGRRTIKTGRVIGSYYLFELLAVTCIHSSQFYFTCICSLLCHSVHDLMDYLGNGLNKMKLHGQMHLEGFADAAHEL